jgi:ABC-type amino acid transport substrate-binding protein
MTVLRFLAALAATVGALAPQALAATPEKPPVDRELLVGVYQAPPWAMKDQNGEWTGLTVDLWKELADDLKLPYRLVEESPDSILDSVDKGRLDTAAGPFAVTLKRERELDFTHGYVVSGVSIAVVRSREADRWLSVVEALSTPTALRLYGAVIILIFVAGTGMWLLERRRNAMFAGRPLQGLGSGFWWAGVTTVAVGYGDKVPITFWGRLVALFWMFVSLILITALTAFVTAKLALADFGRVQGSASLHNAAVGSVEGSAGTEFLERQGIAPKIYPSPSAAVDGLIRGDVTALVYGSVVLRYFADRNPQHRIQILPGTIEAFNFAFPLPDGSPLREPLNGALRRVLAEAHWQDLRTRYLGGASVAAP